MNSLDRLLRPKSIAVLGAGWALNVIEQCAKMGFKGPVWPVHPTKAEIGGLKAYLSLADLPEPPDATFIGVNRHATLEVVEELRRIGGFRRLAHLRGIGVEIERRLPAHRRKSPRKFAGIDALRRRKRSASRTQ